jgi:hypothetical protein
VLHRLPAPAHGLWHPIEPGLHCVEDTFVPQGWTFVDLGEVPEKMFNARLRSHIVLSFKEDAIGIRLPPSLPRLRGREGWGIGHRR